MDSYFSNKFNRNFTFLTLGIILLNLWVITMRAPMIEEQEWAQRIFYYHVPLAWNAFLAYFTVMVCSIFYLVYRKSTWDSYALAAAEVGTLFTLLILLTGPIWAKPIWGKAWTWEPRLTTTLILFLIYIGYFMVREFGGSYERSSRFAAIIGILAFIDVPIVYYAVDFWAPEAQSHPQRDMSGHGDLVFKIFLFSLFSFTLLLINLLKYRIHTLRIVIQNKSGKNV